MGLIYGYEFDGVYQSSDFITTPNGSQQLKPGVTRNDRYTTGPLAPGVVKYKDQDGDGVITTNDRTVIGNACLLYTSYTPNKGKMEEATEGPTSYTTNVPTLKGSLEGVVYRIANITPATDKIKIDASTGVISVVEVHDFKAGETYVIDVNVKNIYNTTEEADKVFESVFTLEVVEMCIRDSITLCKKVIKKALVLTT